MPCLAPLTRQEALLHWKAFLPKIRAYASTRNHVATGHPHVSRLSAALRFRTILEDEVLEQTLRDHSFESAEKWLQEVCWRRYWKGWLEMRPQVWTHWRRQVRTLRLQLPAQARTRALAVMSAESGVACMDQIARELLETGYLHNHARMWWASFWVHVEKLPWELGADFFFRHLLDADPASNTLSWRWVAGLQTPGKTYLVRLSNLQKYAPDYLSRYPSGCERLADASVEPVLLSEDSAVCAKAPLPPYPTFLQHTPGRSGLWLHPDDLTPEIGPLASFDPVAIATCLNEPVYRDTYQLSQRRIQSLHTVLHDGLNRAAAHYGCSATACDAPDPVAALCAWAKHEALQEVVSFAPTVGPIADLLPRLTTELETRGIRLTLLRRPSDATAFSLATAGFFPFWQKMSRLLNPDSIP